MANLSSPIPCAGTCMDESNGVLLRYPSVNSMAILYGSIFIIIFFLYVCLCCAFVKKKKYNENISLDIRLIPKSIINAMKSHVRWTMVYQPDFMSTKILTVILKFIFTKTDIFLAFLCSVTAVL